MREALAHASRAHALAKRARQKVAERTGRAAADVPIIQYRYTTECVDPRPADRRVRSTTPAAASSDTWKTAKWLVDPEGAPGEFEMAEGECVC